MKKTILLISLILVGGLFAASQLNPSQIQGRANMRGNRQGNSGQGLGNGSRQRKMDGTGPRAQRGECLRNETSETNNNRLHLAKGKRDGSGQRQMDGTGLRAQEGKCLRNKISETINNKKLHLAQGPRDGSGQGKKDGTGPRGQQGECLNK